MATGRTPRYNVLVVDDQASWRDIVCEMLSDDFDMQQAAGLREALDRILTKTQPFHVVISDIRLIDEDHDNADGMLLAQELRLLGPQTNVILLTGYPTVDSVKHAVGALAVFDYLEKVPVNGSFSHSYFRQVVWRAALEAERARKDGFTRPDRRILVVERNRARAREIVRLLQSSGYIVDDVPIDALSDRLVHAVNMYALILINAAYVAYPALPADMIRRLQPQARVLLLSDMPVGGLVHAIREMGALEIISLAEKEFDPLYLRKQVEAAFSPLVTRYAVAQIAPQEAAYVGSALKLEMQLHEHPKPGSVAIEMPIEASSGRRSFFEVFVHAPGMKLVEGTTAYWELPARGRPSPFMLNLSPQSVGMQEIRVELTNANLLKGIVRTMIDVKVG